MNLFAFYPKLIYIVNVGCIRATVYDITFHVGEK